MLCSYKNSHFVETFVAINVSVEVFGPTGVLFNEVLGDYDFKLTSLNLKTCWPFPNETDLTRMNNFTSL